MLATPDLGQGNRMHPHGPCDKIATDPMRQLTTLIALQRSWSPQNIAPTKTPYDASYIAVWLDPHI